MLQERAQAELEIAQQRATTETQVLQEKAIAEQQLVERARQQEAAEQTEWQLQAQRLQEQQRDMERGRLHSIMLAEQEKQRVRLEAETQLTLARQQVERANAEAQRAADHARQQEELRLRLEAEARQHLANLQQQVEQDAAMAYAMAQAELKTVPSTANPESSEKMQGSCMAVSIATPTKPTSRQDPEERLLQELRQLREEVAQLRGANANKPKSQTSKDEGRGMNKFLEDSSDEESDGSAKFSTPPSSLSSSRVFKKTPPSKRTPGSSYPSPEPVLATISSSSSNKRK